MEPLSKGQQKALDAIKASITLTGLPPTREELGKLINVDPSWAHRLLKRLAAKGYIRLTAGKSRGIRVIGGMNG